MRSVFARLGAAAALLVAGCGPREPLDFSGPTADWPEYAGDKGGLHYSPLTQVTRANVGRLELVWSHHSGDFNTDWAKGATTSLQVTPLVVNDTLYYCTPYMRVFALDPETGTERWQFDPVLKHKNTGGPYPLTCRGVAYWQERSAAPRQTCSRRLIYGTRDSELIALDADTGKPCEDFGTHG